MSFFRPEARALLRRWAETGAYAAATVAGLVWLWPEPAAPLWRWLFPAAAAALGFWFLRAAIVSALAEARGAGPGVVLIDERRVTYLGPHDGGVISIDELRSVEIARDRWRLSDDDGSVDIPAAAEGAAALPDALAALPGFSAGRALQALAAREPCVVSLWSRIGDERVIGLAPTRRSE